MLALPNAFQQKTNTLRAQEPMLVAAIFADNGAADSLATYSRLAGVADIAAVDSSNITILKNSQELVLTAGSAVPLNISTALSANVVSSEWGVAVTHHYHTRGIRHWYGWENVWVDDGLTYAQISNPTWLQFRFAAIGSCTVDSIRLKISNAGNCATVATLQFYDMSIPASPAAVGNAIQISMAAFSVRASDTISGFAVPLVKNKAYLLQISYIYPATSSLGAGGALGNPNSLSTQNLTANYNVKLSVSGYATTGIPALWQIPLAGAAVGIPLGGRAGYQASGIAWRSLDVLINKMPAPSNNGIFSYTDVLIAGTGLTVAAFATNSAALAGVAGIVGWDSLGVLLSGASVPPYRFWRFKVSFTSTAFNDDTPRLLNISVSYMQPPILLGTHAQPVSFPASGNSYNAITTKAINSVSSNSASLQAQAKTVMTGRITLTLAPEPLVEQLFSHYLRGKRVVLRAGYADIPETALYYDGIIRDIAFQRGAYILTIQDPIELADVSVPRNKWPAWRNDIGYASGVSVTYLDKAYTSARAIAAPINGATNPATPDVTPADWLAAASIWQQIKYVAGTHLCTIAADILQNQINLPDEKINLPSLAAVAAKFPARVTGGRTITSPTKGLALLCEIAWLLESYWALRDGQLCLIAEPDIGALAAFAMTPNDIKEGLEYRRGVAELKNEILIFTQWTESGNNGTFLDAIGIADADSIFNYQIVAVQEFQDKWNVPRAELLKIAQNFLNRWKNGRRIVRVDASMRTQGLEPGDTITLTSKQLPVGDSYQFNGIVMQKDLNWLSQCIQLTFMEN